MSSRWAVGLVLMKVVVCAYLSYVFAQALVKNDGSEDMKARRFRAFRAGFEAFSRLFSYLEAI